MVEEASDPVPLRTPTTPATSPTSMRAGTVVAIQIARGAAAPMEQLTEARLIPGRGIEGDRYADAVGTYSAKAGTGREVTLIEEEAVAAVRRDYGITIEPADTRRNIVTRGISLSHLVDREFRAGTALLRGRRLCEPCTHVEEVSGKRIRAALVHRGGLRADIVVEGVVRVGDTVDPGQPPAAPVPRRRKKQ